MRHALKTLGILLIALMSTAEAQNANEPAFLDGEVAPISDQDSALSAQLLRIVDLEEQMRLQQGIIEELRYRLGQLEAKLAQQRIAASKDTSGAMSPAETVSSSPRDYPTPVTTASQPREVFIKNTPEMRDSAAARAAYEAAFELIKQEQYEKAAKAFADYVEQFPNTSLTENALYWHAETYFARGQYAESAIEFLKAYQTYPIGNKAPDNLLKLAISLGKIGKTTEACGTLDKLGNEFPNAPLAIKQRSNQEYIALDCS